MEVERPLLFREAGGIQFVTSGAEDLLVHH